MANLDFSKVRDLLQNVLSKVPPAAIFPNAVKTFLPSKLPSYQQMAEKPLSNLRTNLSFIFNPQTRADWFRGFTLQTPKPIENIKQNLRILSNPETADIWSKGLNNPAAQYFTNRYIKPLAQTPYNLKKAASPKSSLPERIEGTLGVLGGLAALVPDPIQDAAIPLYDLYKGIKAYQLANKGKKLKPLEAIQKGGIPALTLEKPVGLGQAISADPAAQAIGNLVELPLMIGTVHKLSKKNIDDLTRSVSRAVKKGDITLEEGQAILGTLKEKVKIKIKPQSQITSPLSQVKPVGESRGEAGGFTPLKERLFFKTAEKSKAVPFEVLESLRTSPERYYVPLSNPSLLSQAEQTISKYGFDKTYKNFLENKLPVEETIAVGELLARKAFKENRFDEGFKILTELGKKGTEYGRGVQSFSIWSRLTPEGMVKYADTLIEKAKENYAKSFTGKIFKKADISLSNEEKKIIYETMQKAAAALDETARAEYTKKALNMISDKIPVGLGDFFETYRYNNMLSGPQTHEKNIFHNTWNTFITPALTSFAEGKPRKAAVYEINAIKSIPKALDGFFNSLRGDADIDLRKVESFAEGQKYKKIPRFFRFASDLMEAQDVFFRKIITASFEAAGKTKDEAAALADEYLLRGKMSQRGKGVISDALRTFGSGLESFGRIFKPVRWFVPFVRTSINSAIMQLEYSPAGFANIAGNQAKRTQMARAFLGSIAALIGAKLALEGKITWSAPADEKEKEFFYAQDKKPFSIKIGNKWVPALYFGPFAFALLLPAAIKHYYEEAPAALTDSGWEKLGKSLSSIIYYWSQSTPMSGLGGFVRTAQGDIDYSAARNLGFTAQQVIPYTSLLRWINNFADDVYRKPKGFIEQLAGSIPGFQKAMGTEAYTEPTGEEAKRDLINQFLPYSIGFEKENAPFYQRLEQERREERQTAGYINQLKKDFKEGKPLAQEQLQTIFPQKKGGETPLAALIERKKLEDLYSKGDQLFGLYLKAPNNEMRQKIQANVVKLGIDFNEGLYNYLSKQETSDKTEYVKSLVSGQQNYLDILVPLRKEGIASGKPILSNGVIDNLYKENLITADERRYLKNLKWDKQGKRIVSGKTGIRKPKTLAEIFSMVKSAAAGAEKIKPKKAKTLKDYLRKNREIKRRFTLADLARYTRL